MQHDFVWRRFIKTKIYSLENELAHSQVRHHTSCLQHPNYGRNHDGKISYYIYPKCKSDKEKQQEGQIMKFGFGYNTKIYKVLSMWFQDAWKTDSLLYPSMYTKLWCFEKLWTYRQKNSNNFKLCKSFHNNCWGACVVPLTWNLMVP